MRWFWGILVVLAAAALLLVVIPWNKTAAPGPAVTPAAPITLPASPQLEPRPEKPDPVSVAPVVPPKSGSPSEAASEPAATTTVRPLPATTPAAGSSPKPVDPAAAADAPKTPTVAPAGSTSPGVASPKTPESVPASVTSPAPASERPAAAAPGRGWVVSGFVGPLRPGELEAMSLQGGLDSVLGLTDADDAAATVPKNGAAVPAAASGVAVDPNAKAKLSPRDDGTTLVDDRFVIKGNGARENPYVVSWEMLVSAQDTYQPRLGRKIIPDRLKMLDGKWVRIAGFIAFPLMAQSQNEMLMMLNQWDGCCIGVPPTPYDAIEVKLKTAAKGEDRLRVSGAITGILRVDPYLVKDWLVSLYLMDDAELTIDGNAPKQPSAPPEGHAPQ